MNKYLAVVIVIVLGFVGLIISYTMGAVDAPGATSAVVHATKDH